MSKQLYLTGKYGSIIGNYAIVDDHLYQKLNDYKWNVRKCCAYGIETFYIRTTINKKKVYLHRFILNVNDSKILVDHKDGNPFNNLLENIRLCNKSQNAMNTRRKKIAKSASCFKGVRKGKNSKGYSAQISKDGKLIHLGNFITQLEAAITYDKKALELHKEFAKINFPERDYTKVEYPERLLKNKKK